MAQESAVTSSTPLSIQRYKAESLTRDLFDKGMAYLEAAKQENFPPQTLSVWFNEMTRLGWTATRFRDRVLSVLQMQTYGKVSFDMFISAPPLEKPKAVSICQIHTLRYVDGHCPKCWSEKLVAMPDDVKRVLRELHDQMEA